MGPGAGHERVWSPVSSFSGAMHFRRSIRLLLPRPSKAIDGRGGGVAEEEEGGARVKLESTGCSAEPEACLISSCMNCGTGSGGAERARSSGTPYKELPTAARAARRAAGRAAAGRAAAGRAAAGRERRRGEWGASRRGCRMGHRRTTARSGTSGAGAPSRRSDLCQIKCPRFWIRNINRR